MQVKCECMRFSTCRKVTMFHSGEECMPHIWYSKSVLHRLYDWSGLSWIRTLFNLKYMEHLKWVAGVIKFLICMRCFELPPSDITKKHNNKPIKILNGRKHLLYDFTEAVPQHIITCNATTQIENNSVTFF